MLFFHNILKNHLHLLESQAVKDNSILPDKYWIYNKNTQAFIHSFVAGLMRGLWLFILLFLSGAIGLHSSISFTSKQLSSPDFSSTSSHSLAITAEGKVICVVNPDSDSVSLVDTASNATLVEIPVGDDPRSVAIGGNLAFVSNHGSDSISVVDLDAREKVSEIPVGDRPLGIAMSPDGRFLAIAEMGQDTIRFIQTQSFQSISVIPVADRPYGLSFTPDGNSLLVSHLIDGTITRLAVHPYSSFFPLTYHAGIPSLSSPAQAQVRDKDQFSTGNASPYGISIPTWNNIAPAPSVVVEAAGKRAYLPQTMGNGQGLNIQFDTTVFPVVSVIDLALNKHMISENISLPELDRPVGLPWDAALAKDGQELWVVNAASNDVSVLDIHNPLLPTGLANIKVSHNPRGILITPDGNTAYVQNALAGTLSVIDTQTYTLKQEIVTTNIPLPPLLLQGKQLFHTSSHAELSQAAWISCNTCHVEGEHDGRTWFVQFLGEVLPGEQPIIQRNTTSLLGMVETYPLRWSAEWDESADSEFSIRFEQFGSGLIPGEMHPTLGTPNQGRSVELDSLAAFIDSLLVPHRSLGVSTAAERGRQIFESPQAGCLECHPPPLYTDLLRHDVGTGDKPGEWFGPEFDTPTLRFLYDSPPYLHDGSSPTLLHMLTAANRGDLHGNTSHLSASQLDDLVEFLLVLPYQ